MTNKKIQLNALIIVAILLVAGIIWLYYPTKTGTATLSWNANTEANLAGYKIYYGTAPRTSDCPDGGYKDKIDIGNQTSYAFNNLTSGKIYYFSVTSYNTVKKESCFSAEVKKIISPLQKINRLKSLFGIKN